MTTQPRYHPELEKLLSRAWPEKSDEDITRFLVNLFSFTQTGLIRAVSSRYRGMDGHSLQNAACQLETEVRDHAQTEQEKEELEASIIALNCVLFLSDKP